MELSRLLSQVVDADTPLSTADQDLNEDFTFAFDLRQKQLHAHRKHSICSWQWASTTAARVSHLLSTHRLPLRSRNSKIHQSYCERLAICLLGAIASFMIVSATNAILSPSYANPST